MGKGKRQTGKTTASAAASEADKAAYWRGKIPRLVAQGKTRDALDIVDRHWPPSAPAARAQTLLRVWPQRLVAELPTPVPPELVEVVALAPLLLDDPDLDRLLAAPALAPLAADLRAARDAQALLAAGDAASARDALSPIGLRSPLRHVRLYLRALASVQAGDDDDARRALAALADTALAPLAARVSAALDGRDSTLATQLGLASDVDPALTEALARLRERRPSEALARLHGLAGRLPEPLLRAVRRELPAALLGAGVHHDDIVMRVVRALGADPDDPGDLRARAQLLEQGGCRHCASERWLALRDAVKKGAALRGVDRSLADAALLARAGHALLAHVNSGTGPDWDDTFWEEDERHLANARRLLEQAIAVDPGRAEAWDDLAEMLEDLGDRSAAIALVEERVAAFPDDPDALLSAAESCARRRSFLKAAAHVKRAAELAPHDPRIRDVEADILVGRAYKQLKSGRADAALETFREAARVPDQSHDERLEIYAAAAVAELSLGDARAVDALREASLADGVGPWEWLAAYYVEAGRHHAAGGGLRVGQEPRFPATPPTAAEIVAVLHRCEDADEDGQRTEMLERLAHAVAVAAAATVLTDPATVRRALGWVRSDEERLALLEQGARCDPKAIDFTLQRYEVALRLRRPRDYFVDALAELEVIIARARDSARTRAGDRIGADEMAEVVELALAMPRSPLDLQRRVRAFLAGSAPSQAQMAQPARRTNRRRGPGRGGA